MKYIFFRLLPLLVLTTAVLSPPPLHGRDTTIFDDLPPHMRVLVDWGQRPEWSLDGKWIYFLPRAYSDIFRIEVASGKIEPVTNHYFHEGYKRVLCLWNGDLLLAGPDQFDASDPWASRHKLRLSILKAPYDQPAIPLDAYCDEGPAVSKSDNRIAWTLPGQREIVMAEISMEKDGEPVLLNRRTVLSFDEQHRPLTERLETQDFVPGRNQLVFTYYHGTVEEPFYYANAYVIDLDTGKLVNLTQNENRYDEAEGIAPDGSFLLIESDRHAEPKQWKVDVYLLKLGGTHPPERLCDWTKYPGFRSDNPVVSPDGKTIAIQRGFRAGAGQGSGIVLFDLESYRRSKP
jgi:hypothetical protein